MFFGSDEAGRKSALLYTLIDWAHADPNQRLEQCEYDPWAAIGWASATSRSAAVGCWTSPTAEYCAVSIQQGAKLQAPPRRCADHHGLELVRILQRIELEKDVLFLDVEGQEAESNLPQPEEPTAVGC